MVCSDTRELIHAYLDGELDLARSLEIEQHLEACPACAKAYSEQKSLHLAIARSSLYYEAPNELRRNVRKALGRADGSESPRRNRWGWQTLWAPLGVMALALVIVLAIVTRPSAENQLAEQIVSAHIRSLMPGHLIDIPSSDKHTVKPWFNGKLDFSPTVKDLADRGFPLIGGRLDYVAGRPVAAVVYQRRKHVINLFIWPGDSAGSDGKVISRQGYHALLWSRNGMTYTAISDVIQADLEQFVGLVRGS